MSCTLTMPSATTERRRSSSISIERFPDLDVSANSGDPSLPFHDDRGFSNTHPREPSPLRASTTQTGRLHLHRDGRVGGVTWGTSTANPLGQRQHTRQQSLSEAFRKIRTRKASVSENAQEIAEALKAPLSIRLVVSIWGTLSTTAFG